MNTTLSIKTQGSRHYILWKLSNGLKFRSTPFNTKEEAETNMNLMYLTHMRRGGFQFFVVEDEDDGGDE